MDLAVVQGLSNQVIVTLRGLEGLDQFDLSVADAFDHAVLIYEPRSHSMVVPPPDLELLVAVR